jgi:hypothetical protein
MNRPTLRTIIVGGAIAAASTIFTALATFDETILVDWRTWAVGLGVAVVRNVAIFVTAQIAGLVGK